MDEEITEQEIRCPHCDKINETAMVKYFVCAHCGESVFQSQRNRKMKGDPLYETSSPEVSYKGKEAHWWIYTYGVVGIFCLMTVLINRPPEIMEWFEDFGKDIEVWKEEYSNGSVKVEYEYYTHSENNKRIKHGYYKSYYEDGGYKEVGNYKESVRNGEWSFYSENGKETNRTY